MLKRWDARNYDIKLILEIFDSIDINIEEMNIPRPKKYDIKFLMKVLLVKEFEKLSLRAAEVRIQDLFGIRVDHSVIHDWEKKLSPFMEKITNEVLKELHKLKYSESFVDSTIFTNKRGEGSKSMQ